MEVIASKTTYDDFRARACDGDPCALAAVHEFHQRRVRFVPEEQADKPGGACIIDAFEAWRAEGGLDKPIDGRVAP